VPRTSGNLYKGNTLWVKAVYLLTKNGKKAMYARILIFHCCILLLSLGVARARVLNVPSAFSTIGAAIADAAAGDTILVAAGTYAESLTINKGLVILGPNANTQLGQPRQPEAILRADTVSQVVLITCNCDVSLAGFQVEANNRWAIVSDGANVNLTLTGNVISGNIVRRTGYSYLSGLRSLVATHNRFRQISSPDTGALHVSNSQNVRIEHNALDTVWAGILLDACTTVVVRHNHLRNIQHQGIEVADFSGPQIDVQIAFNTIIQANRRAVIDQGGIRIDGRVNFGFRNVTIVNNIVESSFNGVAVRNLSQVTNQGLFIRYNAFIDNANAALYHGGTGAIEAGGNFWNAAAGPVDRRNPVGGASSRIVQTGVDSVRYAPWLSAFSDSDTNLPGYQLPQPATYILRRATPSVDVPMRAVMLADTNDVLAFENFNFESDTLYTTKSLTLASNQTTRLGSLRAGGLNSRIALAINGNFRVGNINLTPDSGAQAIVRTDATLFFTGTIVEAPGRTVVGRLQTTRLVGQNASDMGGMGVSLSEGRDNLGDVTATRISGTNGQLFVNGTRALGRHWVLDSDGGLPARGRLLTLNWFSEDDNGLPLSVVAGWVQASPGGSWRQISAVRTITGQPRIYTDSIKTLGTFTIAPVSPCLSLQANAGADRNICSEQRIALVANPFNANFSYSWRPTTGLESPNDQTTVARPTVTTTYTLTVRDRVNNCLVTDQVTIVVNQRPQINVADLWTICRGDSVQINGSGGVDYRWLPSVGISNPRLPNPKASPDTTTTYSLVVTNENNCSDTARVLVNVVQVPTPELLIGDTTVCAGDSLRLSVRPNPDVVAFRWSPSENIPFPNFTEVIAFPMTNTTFTVTALGNNNCTSTAVVPVTVRTAPNIYIQRPVRVCRGDSVQLLATGGQRFSWFPENAFNRPMIGTPLASPRFTTVYTVETADAFGCRNIDTVMVQVLSRPTVEARADTAICFGQSLALTANGGILQTWHPTETLDESGDTVLARPTRDTRYIVRVFAANGCTADDTVHVRVLALPTVSAGFDQQVCAGSTATLQAFGGIRYRWEPITGLSAPDSNITNVRPMGTTQYTVTATNRFGCSAMDTVEVSATFNPVPVFSPAGAAVCPNSEGVRISAGGGVRYSWLPATGLSDPNAANVIADPSQTTTYTVTVMGENNCTSTARIRVSVIKNEEPLIEPAGAASLCSNGALNLQASPGAQSYQWLRDGIVIPNATQSSLQVTGAGAYAVRVVSNGCIATSAPTAVSAQPLTQADAGPSAFTCRDGSGVQLNGSGGVAYMWMPSEGLNFNDIPNPIARPTSTTTYTLMVTDAAGCRQMDTVTVFVGNPPSDAIVVLGETRFCAGGQVEIAALEGRSNTIYRWSVNGQELPGEMESRIMARTSGNYQVEIRRGGCEPVRSRRVAVSVLPLPMVQTDANRLRCLNGEAIQLRAQASPDAATGGSLRITWSPDVALSDANILQPLANPTRNISYTLTVVDTNNCKASAEVSVTVISSLDQPILLRSSDRVCGVSNVRLETEAVAGLSYAWYRDGNLLNAPDTNVFLAQEPGTFAVEVSTEGCAAARSADLTLFFGPKPVLINDRVQDAHCPTCANGIIVVRGEGGTPPFRFAFRPNEAPAVTNSALDLLPGVYNVRIIDALGCSDTLAITVGFWPVSRPSVNDAATQMTLYPNPNQGVFSVDVAPSLQPLSWTLYDVTGAIVQVIEPTQMVSGRYSLQVRPVAGGVYWLVMQHQNGSIRQAVMIMP
jgi:hypothetical protein